MIDPDSPSSPSSSQPLAQDREAPHCQPIVTQSMPVAPQSAEEIDDQQWTEIVVQSLKSRSREAREALLKALLNDELARSVRSSNSMEPDWGNGGPGVSGNAAAAHDQAQASFDVSNNITSTPNHGDGSDNVETSPRTVPPIPPLRSNASDKASGKDRLNGQRNTARSIPSDPRANPVGCTKYNGRSVGRPLYLVDHARLKLAASGTGQDFSFRRAGWLQLSEPASSGS